MAYQYDAKTGQIVINGWEQGIAPSPHKGIANLKAVNISTETKEVMANFGRVQQSQTPIAGQSIVVQSGNTLLNINSGPSQQLKNGTWIVISGSSGTPANGPYYVFNVAGTTAQTFQIASTFGGTALTGFTGSVGSFATIDMGQPLASATEYINGGFYRYYILDINSHVWVNDTSQANFVWALIDNDVTTAAGATGIAALNGWLIIFAPNIIYAKPTVYLSKAWGQFSGSAMNSIAGSTNPHFAFIGHQSTCYFTDSNFVGSIFPTSGTPNIFSYASFTSSSTTGTIATLFGGTIPSTILSGSAIPVVIFAGPGGAVATALGGGGASNAIFYLGQYNVINKTFQIFSSASNASSGTSPIDITTGASGTQYFNTFYPVGALNTFGSTYVYSPQALTLPFFEVAQALTEISNLVIVGCKSNTIYQWNQENSQASDFIPLPENNITYMISVNNMAYVFAGSKGNIYITNGSTASLALSIPDYTAGQIEPYFLWGGAGYIRGRVFFSVQDQNASHTGQCGGIWSFVPTQNFFIGQDFGLALRMENQNSYGSYNGVANIILNSQNQNANGPQYWSAWSSNISGATYGIDFSDTNPATTTPLIETDIIPVGSYSDPSNFAGIEIKLSAPLVAGESVQVLYRNNLSFSAFQSVGTMSFGDVADNLNLRFKVPFSNVRWVQFQALLTPTTIASNTSFVRVTEMRIYRQV